MCCIVNQACKAACKKQESKSVKCTTLAPADANHVYAQCKPNGEGMSMAVWANLVDPERDPNQDPDYDMAIIWRSAKHKAQDFIECYRTQMVASSKAGGGAEFAKWTKLTGVSSIANHVCKEVDGEAPKKCPDSTYRDLVEKCFRQHYLKDKKITFTADAPWEYAPPLDSGSGKWTPGFMTKLIGGTNQIDCTKIVPITGTPRILEPEDAIVPIMCAFATGGVLLEGITRAKWHANGHIHIRRMLSLLYPELFPEAELEHFDDVDDLGHLSSSFSSTVLSLLSRCRRIE